MATKLLSELLDAWAAAFQDTDLPRPPVYNGPDVALTGFVEHSNRVEPGHCFVARVRTGSDGHPYIGQAVSRGASLILGQREQHDVAAELASVPYLQVEDTAVALAWLAAAWHGFPGFELVCVGVTGTDGKTTTVNLLQSILKEAGIRTGMLSTIKASLGEREEPLALHVTTPEAPVVQAYLRRMVDAGLTHCVIEATSHGLAQHRLDAIPFDVAVVTNITHEHLDYHGDYEGYFQAKSRLFEGLRNWEQGSGPPATAVLNRDDASFERLDAIGAGRRISYAINQPADVQASDIRSKPAGTTFTLSLSESRTHSSDLLEITITSPLIGRFNVYNMLAAAAAGHALEIKPEAIQQGIGLVNTLSGRMETVDLGQPFQVVVDFAHTPYALENALKSGKEMSEGRLIAVFGSAGKRDVAKRRWMAQISARLADMTILTAEDPRTEPLASILDEMAQGCRDEGRTEGEHFWRVADRGRAIYFALGLARPGDIVLICGKGHEQSMCFGTVEYPWDDVAATRTALDALLSDRPMPDLGLPTFEE